jgi:type II secretory pathway pseudopilin PulG
MDQKLNSPFKQQLLKEQGNHQINIMNNFLKKRINIKLVSGFTLVEALVAISILMIAIASPISISQKSLSTAILSRDQMTAAYLAQDAIEAVKNIRDEIAITSPQGSTDWLGILNNCLCTGESSECSSFNDVNYCNIDTTTAILDSSSIKVSGDGDNPLRIAQNIEDNIFIKYDLDLTGVPSKYSRFINIKVSPDNQNEALISVRVSWSSPIGTQTIDIRDFIYNYSENIEP